MNRSHTLATLACLWILVVSTVPRAQAPSTPWDADYDIIKTDTNLVTVNVSVTRKNRPISDLTVDDFEITDTGAVVKPEFFETHGPASIVFVIDISSSMLGAKWRNLTSAMKQFLRSQPTDTNYSLIVFSDRPTLVSEAIDAKDFWKKFSAIHPDGETALYDGLALGLDQIPCLSRHHKAVILLSDGEDNKSHSSLATIEHQVLQTHATIYAVGILIESSQPDRYRGRELLKTLASETGGLSYFPLPDQTDKVLSDINKQIASEYSFGYYAPNPQPGPRSVDVRLTRPLNGSALRYPQRYLLK
jgi:VWFA-related protein